MKKSRTILAFLVIALFFSMACVTQARNLQDAFVGEASPLKTAGDNSGFATGGEVSVESIVAQVITTLLSFLGVIFVVLIIYGGYNWMTAGGDNSKVETAKNTITRATIGLIIVVGAYAISYFVIKSFASGNLTETLLE